MVRKGPRHARPSVRGSRRGAEALDRLCAYARHPLRHATPEAAERRRAVGGRSSWRRAQDRRARRHRRPHERRGDLPLGRRSRRGCRARSPDVLRPSVSPIGARIHGNGVQVPWTRIGNDAHDWPRAGLEELHRLGYVTAAMALSDDSIPLDDARLAACERLALVFGTEGDGLDGPHNQGIRYTVRIPMAHHVDSLNVAAASAVAFWELCREGEDPHAVRRCLGHT